MLTPEEKRRLFGALPKVDAMVAADELAVARRRLGHGALTSLVRETLRLARERAATTRAVPDRGSLLAEVAASADALLGRRARRVINASGVVLHTNLGRAPLSTSAVAALADSAKGYTSIEIDLASGRRGPRGAFMESALSELSGAEAALVVNNCAAAVLLVLTALARGRGVVVSRGELVEIGGSFRIPDVLERSGARMIEVGTTNRTRVGDYERALDENDDVAVLLRVHRSNFRQVGFVEEPSVAELAELADRRGVLLVHDLGGGAMVDPQEVGLSGEPLVRQCVEAGAHVVCFSGDKLLGGPQAGVIVGATDLVTRARRDPLARALRLGRLPMVALEATLASYLEGDLGVIPALATMRRDPLQVKARVEQWQRHLAEHGVAAEVVELGAQVGGGTLASMPLPSWGLAFDPDEPDAMAKRLRLGDPPVLPRIQDDRLLIDGRTVLPDEDDELLATIRTAFAT
jgi:L-seryl-tRNA(Ser) seleniumtransferase